MDPPDWLNTLHQIYLEIDESQGSSNQSASPKCDMSKPSKIQYTLFNDGHGNGVYKAFCDKVNKDPKMKLVRIVDSHGNIVPPRERRSMLRTRTPPADPDAENGYTIDLEWTGGDGSCTSTCSTSFDAMVASPCAHLGSEQNNMATSALLDTGCGIYSYKINPPPGTAEKDPAPPNPIPQPSSVQCNQFLDEYKKNKKCWHDIQKSSVDAAINNFNQYLPMDGNVVDSTMRGLKYGYTKVWQEQNGGTTYLLNVNWVPGCTNYKTMVVDNPQGKSGDAPQEKGKSGPTPGHSISCTDIFMNTY